MADGNKAPMAVVEHALTLPMALAIFATACGWVASSHFFADDSPWKQLLEKIALGMPTLIALLGQLWHSQNIRNKVEIANRAINGVNHD